ncbi:MAG: hypothetical protein QGG36_15530 [Pirellulaceae bacterium]|jgi:hypothetical protein|nr:hypothetical protein [Pirellulaceae bacterium]MDP7017216.1 hypothetical protein [Pirellulaceae bacterium]
MSRKLCTLILSFCALGLICADLSHALPRRRRARRYSTSASVVRVAQTTDSTYADYASVDAFFNYETSMKDEFAFEDRIRVFVDVRDPELLAKKKSIVAEVKIKDLSDARRSSICFVPVKFEAKPDDSEFTVASFDISNKTKMTTTVVEQPVVAEEEANAEEENAEKENADEPTEQAKQPAAPADDRVIRPARTYRLFVNFHRSSKEYGEDTVVGRVRVPYYVATGGPKRIDRARRGIVMRTFREYYYRKQGWRTDENYVMDCHAYYMWATGFCTKGAQNGRTLLGRLFNNQRPFNNGSEIATIAEKEPIHGDYVRIPGHTFMLLAYDADAGQVWTMEGNFGASIEIAVRHAGSGWNVGHLVDDHIATGMFE